VSELIYPFGAEQIREKVKELRFLNEDYEADRWERILKKKFQKTAEDEPTAVILKTERALELETKGWEVWLKTLSPHTFKSKFVKEIGDFWEWYWPLILAQAEGKHLLDITDTLAYTLFLARGLTKSTTMEWAALMQGAVVGPSLVLYTCSTGKTATRHLQSMTIHAERSLMEEYYPGLARPRVGKHKNRFGWNKDMLAADCGLTILALGLEEEIRGVRVEDLRPTLIEGDDFDSMKDSPDVVKKKEDILGGSIFGTQTEDTIIILGQNLIHRFSVARRIHLGRSELLRDRRSSGVVKAFTDDFAMEQQPNGRYMITKGTPTWEGFNMKLAQKIVGTMGPVLARSEYQHEFDIDQEGKVMKNYLDGVHVITEEEFCRPYGLQWHPAFKMPFDWWKYMFNDYARTKSEFHANVAGTLTVSSMNTKLPGITFLFDCLSFEENTEPDDCAIAFLRCISPFVRVDGVDRDWDILRQTLISREGIANYVGSKTEKNRAERAVLARVFPEHVAPLLQAYNYRAFRMSHEKDDWAKIYRNTFGLPFERPAPNDDAGQALLDLSMKIDFGVADPFGRVGYWADDKQTFIRDPFNKSGKAELLQGMSRFYLIVKNDKLPYPNDARPDQLHGSDLARYQFNEQRYLSPKANELGEEERDAEKRNDDFRQGILMYYFDNSLRGRELSKVEQQELELPESVQLQAIKSAPPDQKEKLLHSREIELRRAEYERLEKNLARGGSPRGNKLVGYRRLRRNSV